MEIEDLREKARIEVEARIRRDELIKKWNSDFKVDIYKWALNRNRITHMQASES
jgi:hypothetical protein